MSRRSATSRKSTQRSSERTVVDPRLAHEPGPGFDGGADDQAPSEHHLGEPAVVAESTQLCHTQQLVKYPPDLGHHQPGSATAIMRGVTAHSWRIYPKQFAHHRVQVRLMQVALVLVAVLCVAAVWFTATSRTSQVQPVVAPSPSPDSVDADPQQPLFPTTQPSQSQVVQPLVVPPAVPTPRTSLSTATTLADGSPIPAVTPARESPLAGVRWFVDPDNPAAAQANQWRTSRPKDAQLMKLIATTPQSHWFGDWDGPEIQAVVHKKVTQMRMDDAMPVLVAYNIPNRDCGNYSAGGVNSNEDYARWIRGFAAGIGPRPAVVVVEPDALPALNCLGDEQKQQHRYAALRDAVAVLSALPNTLVYIDAGTVNWHQPQELAHRLRQVGIERVQGFSLNVSNYRRTKDLQDYGDAVSRLVDDKHYIIDTSRNGQGPLGTQWCNPSGRGLGQRPTSATGRPHNDALLWIKRPGNSDGTCKGGPKAGQWWPEQALGLAQRAKLDG